MIEGETDTLLEAEIDISRENKGWSDKIFPFFLKMIIMLIILITLLFR